MADSKHTRRALLGSALALILCFAMLLGTTFAWFTDKEVANVTIKAGTLDIELLDKTGAKLDGPIKWIAKDNKGNALENPLWEPGASYRTDTFIIHNLGNLALKYKVCISGIDTKYIDKFTFTVLQTGANISPTTENATLDASNDYSFEGYLLPESEGTSSTDPEYVRIKLTVKMNEDAGNDCQGLDLNDVKITVLATQYTYEKNSNNQNDYDKNATYPALTNTQP